MSRSFKIRLFRMLRNIGLLCKKPKPTKLKVRVQSTVYPKEILSSVEFQAYHYLLNKKNSYKGCMFDVETRSCECGIILDEFGAKGCKNKVKKQLILG